MKGTKGKKVIMLADMESFFASVEVARNPSLRGKPVVVCGDPAERRGIVLAATREAKAFGVKTGMLVGECARTCPGAVFVRPHMEEYIGVSVQATQILERFTDRVSPYSIDEQFLDMTGCEKLFGSPEDAARRIAAEVCKETGVRCRLGIGNNPLQAKMACDCFAKKNREGIFRLSHDNYAVHTWPLPVGNLFGVGARMKHNLFNMGIRTIGHLAALPKETLRLRWGINGEILWLNAHGIDHSTVKSGAAEEDRKGVGSSATLPRDYRGKREIEVVLLEITEEVCRRARALVKAGRTAGVYCRGADFDFPSSFSRQKKLPGPTATTMELYPHVLELFHRHWDRRAVRALGVSLTGLTAYGEVQLSLLQDRKRKMALDRAIDSIRERFGPTSLFRLSSLTVGGQLFTRAGKIGGHEA